MSQHKYKAFISYSHVDAKISKWLHKKLETYRIPRRLVGTKTKNGTVPAKLFPIFRDRDDLAATTHMTDAILDAVRDSEFMIVICTPASARSKLVNREIQEFKRLNGNHNILCLIADGVPFAEDPAQECFSDVLQKHISPEGVPEGYSPEGLAADIRPGSDGKQAAVSKLVAGIIGVELNVLVRREMQQQKKRLVGALAGTFSVLVVISVLLLKTTEAQRIAETRTENAVNLLTYLHEIVFEALDADGNTMAQEALVRAVFENYDKLDLKNADVGVLSAWSAGGLRLGQNLERQGRNEEAAILFQEIRDFSIRFAEDHPRHPAARFRRQNAEFFYGYLKLRTGEYNEAEQSFRIRLNTVIQAANDPLLEEDFYYLPAGWSAVIADVQSLLGMVLAGPQDQLAEAQSLLEKSSDNRLRAISQYRPDASPFVPNNNGLKISLASTYLHLGDLYRRKGETERAQKFYKNRIDLLANLLNEDPNDLNVTRRISVAELKFAQTLMDRGDAAGALDLTRGQVKTFQMLTERNPSSVLWFSGLVEAQIQLADLCLLTGSCSDVEQQLADAFNLSGQLAARDGQRPHYRLTHYRARMLHAEHLIRISNVSDAMAELTALIDVFNTEENSFIRTNGAMEVAARTLLLATLAAKQQNKENLARQYAQAVIDIVQARPSPWLEAKAYQAAAARYLGQQEEAERTLAELDASGFSHATYLDLWNINQKTEEPTAQ